MGMNETRIDDSPVVWEKFECEAGCRWTQMIGHTATIQDGDRCDFVGCTKGYYAHHVHSRGYTSDRNEASAWYHNVHERD